jgi:hypothetical protein
MLRTTVAQIATAAETPIPTLAFPITCAAIHLPLDLKQAHAEDIFAAAFGRIGECRVSRTTLDL